MRCEISSATLPQVFQRLRFCPLHINGTNEARCQAFQRTSAPGAAPHACDRCDTSRPASSLKEAAPAIRTRAPPEAQRCRAPPRALRSSPRPRSPRRRSRCSSRRRSRRPRIWSGGRADLETLRRGPGCATSYERTPPACRRRKNHRKRSSSLRASFAGRPVQGVPALEKAHPRALRLRVEARARRRPRGHRGPRGKKRSRRRRRVAAGRRETEVGAPPRASRPRSRDASRESRRGRGVAARRV